MLVKIFLSNKLIDKSNKINKYIQYKHNEKHFEMVCLNLHTVIVLHCYDGNENLLEMFGYPSNSHAFYRPELNL